MRLQLPVVSFVSTALVLLAFPTHWNRRAHNASTLLALVWLALCNVVRGVNSIIWGGNTIVRYQIWCDISTKLEVGASIGIPGSIMCISRYLAWLSSPHHATACRNNERRRMKLEVGICGGLPIITMALHYIVQSRRFLIYEDFGCAPAVFRSVAALFIFFVPSLLLSLAALVYGGVALRWLIHRRAQSQNAQPQLRLSLSPDRYIRLVILILTQMTFSTVITLIQVSSYLAEGLDPWESWENVHSDWWDITTFPRDALSDDIWASLLTSWYFVPVASVIFFGFFGLGSEVTTACKKVFNRLVGLISRLQLKLPPVLPVHTARHANPISSPSASGPFPISESQMQQP